jgi:hypothetical protein
MSDLDNYLDHDYAARRNTTLLSVAAGAGTGMLLEWGGAPSKLATACCVAAVGAIEVARAWRYVPSAEKERVANDTPLTARRHLILTAATTTIFLLAISFYHLSRIQRLVVEAGLTSAQRSIDVGEIPYADSNLHQVTTALQTLTIKRAPAPASFFVSATGKLDQMRSTGTPADVHPALVQLAEYRTAVIERPPDVPKPGSGAYVGHMDQVGGFTHIKDSYFDGEHAFAGRLGVGAIDGLFLENVTFENATIVYYGGPLILKNVHFINCKFTVPNSSQGDQLLLAAIKQPANTQIG